MPELKKPQGPIGPECRAGATERIRVILRVPWLKGG